MAIDRWFIGGGAEHTPEAVRRALYSSTGGAEGVGSPADLRVLPLAVPGQGVRVVVGSALIRSRYVGGDTQTYMGTVYEQETAAIVPAGSGAGRSDMVVMRVEDPFAAGSPYPPPDEGDIANAPYVFIRVISGVPSDARTVQEVPGHANDTAVALARIDLPPSTGTVTEGEIVDLRSLPAARRARQMFTVYPTGATGTTRPMPAPSYGSWPLIGGERPIVRIPEWATVARIQGTMMGIHYTAGGGDVVGALRTALGTSEPGQHTIIIEDSPSSAGRHMFGVLGTHKIPEAMRGTSVPIDLQAARTAGTGTYRADYQSSILIDIEFSEEL